MYSPIYDIFFQSLVNPDSYGPLHLEDIYPTPQEVIDVFSRSPSPRLQEDDDFNLEMIEQEIAREMSYQIAQSMPDDTNYNYFYSIQDMDTQYISQKLLIKLKNLKISPLEFAEKVLQGTLSDVLRRPKPWKMMKTSEKDTFRRIYWFLELHDGEKREIMSWSIEEIQQFMHFPPRNVPCNCETVGNVLDVEVVRKRAVSEKIQKYPLKISNRNTSRSSRKMMYTIG